MATAKIAFIWMGDDGAHGTKIGCGDSIILMNCPVPQKTNEVETAINGLLITKSAVGCTLAPGSGSAGVSTGLSGLENTIATKPLALDHVNMTGLNAHDADIYLKTSGQITLGGVCESPRLQEQVTQTAKAVTAVDKVSVYLDGSVANWAKLFNEKG